VILAVKVGSDVLDAVGVKVLVCVEVEVIVGVFVGGVPIILNLPDTIQVLPTNN
jgi:hypothetical protein